VLRNPLRGLPREVSALVAVAFAVAIGFGIVAPAIPLFATHFGVNRAAAGAVISAFAAARLVSALAGGWLVDRVGERTVLALGIGIVAVSSALAGVAQSYAQLIVLRGVGGVGSAMFTVSALSLLLRSVSAEQRGQASGLFSGGFLLGAIAGPAVGGLVVGIDIRLPFFLYAGTLAVAGTIALTMLRREPPRSAADVAARPARIGLGTALRHPAYRAAMITNLADAWAVLGVRSALLPLFVTQQLHHSSVWTGIGFAVVSLVNGATLLPAGRIADRLGRKRVMLLGCFIGTGAMAILALVENLPGFLIAMVVFGLGSGLLDVAPAAVVGDVVGPGGGTAVAGYQMAGDAGVVIGPVVTGHLVDVTSYGAAFGVTGGVLALAGALVAIAPETFAGSEAKESGADVEGSAEIGEQVVDALDTYGATDEIARDLEG
jgi:MFS transporter, DHA1 family, multidrug resistance protein